MVKVITYGTYDMLHYGHVRLLERAKALGDYLIVGVTSDDFDKTRGKINIQQSLMERVEAVRETGLADEIIIEEYEGQKIDDIKRLDVDIFTVGSDWEGHFDYLNEYCKVVYLPRTQGISSSEIRSARRVLKMGMVGDSKFLEKFMNESSFVNGLDVCGICATEPEKLPEKLRLLPCVTSDYSKLLGNVDAVYIISPPSEHYIQIKQALECGKHVLCESPIVTSPLQYEELLKLSEKEGVILTDALRTAYSTAYSRLLLLIKSGKIGKVISVDAVCTSLRKVNSEDDEILSKSWNSISTWGPTAMLPIFQILGTDYNKKHITSNLISLESMYDNFTKVDFTYDNAVASIRVGRGVKSESDLIISGTRGYIYVPAPWWKTDYFEVRYENPADNKRYFYQLDGEGIRYELVAFVKAVESGKRPDYIPQNVSEEFCKIINDYNNRNVERIINS